MKVFVNQPHENWICDRFAEEWYSNNLNISTRNLYEADVIWLQADWAWNQLPIEVLKKKKVLTTVHHITPEKFGQKEAADFAARDQITYEYHVPCLRTADFISNLTKKPIHVFPFWVNSKLWSPRKEHENVHALRDTYNIPNDVYVIGSWQRDTEGKDLISPKLEKGPDRLVDAIIKTNKQKHVHVLLAGWRRQYVMSRLKDVHIPYTYIELPSNDVIRQLYLMIDMYYVTARVEGGPQSIVEAAAMKVPIVSTPVGLAEHILSPESICEDVTLAISNVNVAYENVSKYFIPRGFHSFLKVLSNL
jgi:glycosyltransferase involved in cell wall biosynthesis